MQKGEVEDSVLVEFRKRQYETMKKKRYGLLHATDMVKPCTRNVFYSKMGKDDSNMDTDTMSIFFAGEAVHRMMDFGEGSEYSLAYNYVDDKKVDLFKNGKLTDKARKMGVKDWLKILVGERDALYDLDGEKVLIDYKTFLSNGYKKRAASDHHIQQLNIYKYLTKKVQNIDVDYGAIIYLDFEDRLSKPLIFAKKLDKIEDIEARLLLKYHEILDALDTGNLPDREISWLCHGYCSYANRCFTEDKVENVKLQVIV